MHHEPSAEFRHELCKALLQKPEASGPFRGRGASQTLKLHLEKFPNLVWDGSIVGVLLLRTRFILSPISVNSRVCKLP